MPILTENTLLQLSALKTHNPLDNPPQVLIKSGFNIMKRSIIVQDDLE